MSTVEQRLDEHWAEIIDVFRLAGAPYDLRFEGTPDDKAWVLEWIQPLVQFEHVTPGKRKALLDPLAKDVSRLVKDIDKIDKMAPSLRRELGITDSYIKQQVNLRNKIRRLTPTVAKSGGRVSSRALKRQAADVGFDMVFQWVMPTLTVGGPWLKLTEILVRIATGREPGDVFRACQDHLRDLEERGVFPRELREEERKALRRLAREDRG
jgi:hypothetical protein